MSGSAPRRPPPTLLCRDPFSWFLWLESWGCVDVRLGSLLGRAVRESQRPRAGGFSRSACCPGSSAAAVCSVSRFRSEPEGGTGPSWAGACMTCHLSCSFEGFPDREAWWGDLLSPEGEGGHTGTAIGSGRGADSVGSSLSGAVAGAVLHLAGEAERGQKLGQAGSAISTLRQRLFRHRSWTNILGHRQPRL